MKKTKMSRKDLRRGAVMELAIIVILVAFAFGMIMLVLLTSATIRTSKQLKDLTLKTELSDAATEFLRDGSTADGVAFTIDDWDAESETGTITLEKDGKTLTVTKNAYGITTWKTE